MTSGDEFNCIDERYCKSIMSLDAEYTETIKFMSGLSLEEKNKVYKAIQEGKTEIQL